MDNYEMKVSCGENRCKPNSFKWWATAENIKVVIVSSSK